MTSGLLPGGTITMITLGWTPCHRAFLLNALCIASWITLGVIGDNVEVIAEACAARTGSGARCFQLYAPVKALTWSSADDFCRTLGLRLAIVQDSQAQEALANLGRPFQPGNSTKHAWIAGRRSTNTIWRAIDSTHSYDVPDYAGRLCSHLVRRDPNMTFDLVAAPCVYTNFTRPSSLCQYQHISGPCEGGWFPLDEQCFRVVTQARGSWYAGRADCRSAGPPGVKGLVAYSHLTDPRLFQELPIETPHTLWVGVYRNPWGWLTANLTELEISDFFWVPGQGTWSSPSDCLYANLLANSSWGATQCSNRLEYVICEQETTVAPRSSQSPPHSSFETDLSNQLTTATVETNRVLQENSIWIGCLAGGMGFLSVVVMISAILLRRRKKGSKPPPRHTGLDEPPPRHTGLDEPPPRHTGLDMSPYAVTTFATSPVVADNGRGLPNGDGASWDHVTPSASGYLEIDHDSHVVSGPSSAVSPYAVATGTEIAHRERSDGVQGHGNNRLRQPGAALRRTTEGSTAHEPPGPQTRVSSDDDDDRHPYLELISSVGSW